MKKVITVFCVLFLVFVFACNVCIAQVLWNKDTQNNPVFTGGGPGTWDYFVIAAFVLYNADSSQYEMWYDGSYGHPNLRPFRIGYATSDDGITWNKRETAVMEPTPGTWDESTVEGKCILRSDSIYQMWYSGKGALQTRWATGYATSGDGIHWVKDTLHNPVLTPGSMTWEASGCLYANVIFDNGEYRMWYNGVDAISGKGSIGHATSLYGISWIKDSLNNPVLLPGPVGDWDQWHVLAPQVTKINGIYHMFYTGFRDPNDSRRKVGYAWSDDGIHWNKYDDPNTPYAPYAESDPVIFNSPGQWDGNLVEASNAILIGDSLYMWYDGNLFPTSTYPWLIGRAASYYDPITGLDFLSDNQPTDFILYQNYPNPFNPKTTISWLIPSPAQGRDGQLAVGSPVKLTVYNIRGQKVASLINQRQKAGSHSIEWDASDVASGIYLYHLETDSYTETRKMVLMK